MARRRSAQDGHVETRTRKEGSVYYRGSWRTYAIALDGKEVPPQRRSAYLGEAAQMTKQQARSKLRLMLPSCPGSDGSTKVATSLRDFIEGDFDRYLKKKAAVTYRVHRNLLDNQVLNTSLADSELVDITFQDCRDLIDVEIQEFENQNQSWDTVRNILKVLRSVLGYAVKMDILKINAAKHVTLSQKPVNHWELVKPEKIDGLIQKLSLQRAAVVRLLASTGMRPGELQALKLRCLDREKKTLAIYASWDEDAAARKRYKSIKNTHSDRTIALDDADIEWLDKYLAERKDKLGPDDFIFANRKGGEPVRQNGTLWRVLKPTAVELGMPFFDWYYLRHWSCSYQAANGTPLDVLHKRLGHRDLRTTVQFYLHIPDERAHEAAKVAASMLKVKADDLVEVA